jgi:hypothetical protein
MIYESTDYNTKSSILIKKFNLPQSSFRYY